MLDQQLPSLEAISRRCPTCGGYRILEPEHGTLTILHYLLVCLLCSRELPIEIPRPGAHHAAERALAWDALSADTSRAPRMSSAPLPDSVRFANCPHGPGRQLTSDGARCLVCRRDAQRARSRERRAALGTLPRAAYPRCEHPEPRRLDRYKRCRACSAEHHRDYSRRMRGES